LSNDEKLAFYERELKPVAEVLHNGTISFPLLKVEHTRLKNAIFARYQKPLESSAALNLHPDDKPGFLAAPFITPAGHPLVTLYVPEAVVLFDMLKKDGSPTWRARFTNDVMVAYFHELHHLELGHPLENVGKGISLEHERKAWAVTCRNVLPLMIDEYHLPVSAVAIEYYTAWTRAEKDENSPAWHEFIRRKYK